MGLFENMNPDLPIALMGIGQGMSQLDAGQAPNMLPAAALMADRRQRREREKNTQSMLQTLQGQLTPQQMEALSKMPPSYAEKIVGQLIAQTLQPPDPMADLNRRYKELQIERMSQPAPRETQYVEGVGLIDKSTGQVIQSYDLAPDRSAAEEKIGMIMEVTNPQTGRPFTREEAIRVEHLLETSRDPMTNSVVVIDKSTGQPVGGVSQSQPQAQPQSQPQAQPQLGFGEPYQNAPSAFGAEGYLKGIANTVTDAIPGGSPVFPETMQAKQDFAALGESIVNSYASAYGRQPPSWLLKNIADLAPQEGRLFEGPGRARAKLITIGRDIETRMNGMQRSLSQPMKPETRQELTAQIAGATAALATIRKALAQFPDSNSEVRSEDVDLMEQYLSE